MNCACGLAVWQLCYNNNNCGRKGKDRWTQLLSLLPSLLLIPLAYSEHRQNSIAVIIDLCIALIQVCVETNLVLCSPLHPQFIPASSSLPSILCISEMSIYLTLHPQFLFPCQSSRCSFQIAFILHYSFQALSTFVSIFMLPFWYEPQASNLSVSQKCLLLFFCSYFPS